MLKTNPKGNINSKQLVDILSLEDSRNSNIKLWNIYLKESHLTNLSYEHIGQTLSLQTLFWKFSHFPSHHWESVQLCTLPQPSHQALTLASSPQSFCWFSYYHRLPPLPWVAPTHVCLSFLPLSWNLRSPLRIGAMILSYFILRLCKPSKLIQKRGWKSMIMLLFPPMKLDQKKQCIFIECSTYTIRILKNQKNHVQKLHGWSFLCDCLCKYRSILSYCCC